MINARPGPALLPAALAAVLVAAVAAASLGPRAAPKAAAETEPLRMRELRFADRPDGGIDVRDARLDRRVGAIEPGHDGFMRSTLRGLVRERKRLALGDELPFELRVEAGGALVLRDPASGRRIELQAFGATNAGAFARLLDNQESLP